MGFLIHTFGFQGDTGCAKALKRPRPSFLNSTNSELWGSVQEIKDSIGSLRDDRVEKA